MNRMREHVFTTVDKDQDGMISFDEFVASTQDEDFSKDEDWDVSYTYIGGTCMTTIPASLLRFLWSVQ